jgi:hypothetical protein
LLTSNECNLYDIMSVHIQCNNDKNEMSNTTKASLDTVDSNKHQEKTGYPSTPLVKVIFSGVSEWLLFNANSAIFQLYHISKLMSVAIGVRTDTLYTKRISESSSNAEITYLFTKLGKWYSYSFLWFKHYVPIYNRPFGLIAPTPWYIWKIAELALFNNSYCSQIF